MTSEAGTGGAEAGAGLSSPLAPLPPPEAATRREIWAWAMFDFANSGYTTVVLTAVFNAYFVGVVAGGFGDGTATLLWTLAVGVANTLVLLSAPLVGAVADHTAAKKRFLFASTTGCVIFTALLALAGPGDVTLAMVLLVLSSFMFATGENFIAAFLPEIATPERMGRISAYGWALGYVGGLLVLGLCLAYVTWASGHGQTAEQYVPVVMLQVAAAFALAATPTFLFLRERAQPSGSPTGEGGWLHTLAAGWSRVQVTLRHARLYTDLFRFLITLTVYHAGIQTVVVLAAIYAQQVLGFSTQETILMILVVNATAAVGALVFGVLQDRWGSVPTLAVTLVLWVVALFIAVAGGSKPMFWVVANLVGAAMGASQSAGRALVGRFSPPGRSAEFFGLWGLASKLAAIVGPVSYGAISYLTGGDHRLALLSTLGYFVLGLLLLLTVNEARGVRAAREPL